jgi:hypothetical protein
MTTPIYVFLLVKGKRLFYEDFVVDRYVAPAVLEIINPSQFGGIPKSSATQAIINMLHTWAHATDGMACLYVFFCLTTAKLSI